MIFICDKSSENNLIQAHFKTWLMHVGKGADIVYITDIDDARTLHEILPDEGNVNATCHIYKSPAQKEGKFLRFKVIDGFQHVLAKKFNSTKKYFFKMDSDTYLMPDNLLAYVNDLHEMTYPKPVLFSNTRCERWFCFGDGSFLCIQ